MNAHEAKARAAAEIGSPVFLTAAELAWLYQHLMAITDLYAGIPPELMNYKAKQEFLAAVNIGIKCSQEMD